VRVKGIWWLAVVGAVCVLAGCGSGSSGSAVTGARTSAPTETVEAPALARYIERGDELCRAGNAAIAQVDERSVEIRRRHGPPADERALLVPLLRERLHLYRRYLRRFERIAPPPHYAGQVSAILAGLRKVEGDTERLELAVGRGDAAEAKALTSEREIDHDRVSAQELEFGFKICGQPAAQPSPSG